MSMSTGLRLATSIGRACFGARGRPYMAFITYLDCSGDAIDPQTRVIAVGGFIAQEERWVIFEDQWKTVLAEFGVSALHMRQFAHSAKGSEFETWKGDEVRRAAFLGKLVDVINNCALQDVGATMILDDYEACNREYLLRETIGSPYALAAFMAISIAVNWHTEHKITEPIMFVFETGDNEQRDFKDMLNHRLPPWDVDLVLEPVFQRKEWSDANGQKHQCVPFQAADLMCYEHAKALTDLLVSGKKQSRKSYHRIMWPPKDRHMSRIMFGESFSRFVKRFNIYPRYNRMIDGSDRVMPLAPLCFVNMDQPLISYSGPDDSDGVGVGDSGIGGGPLPGMAIRTRVVASN